MRPSAPRWGGRQLPTGFWPSDTVTWEAKGPKPTRGDSAPCGADSSPPRVGARRPCGARPECSLEGLQRELLGGPGPSAPLSCLTPTSQASDPQLLKVRGWSSEARAQGQGLHPAAYLCPPGTSIPGLGAPLPQWVPLAACSREPPSPRGLGEGDPLVHLQARGQSPKFLID